MVHSLEADSTRYSYKIYKLEIVVIETLIKDEIICYPSHSLLDVRNSNSHISLPTCGNKKEKKI